MISLGRYFPRLDEIQMAHYDIAAAFSLAHTEPRTGRRHARIVLPVTPGDGEVFSPAAYATIPG